MTKQNTDCDGRQDLKVKALEDRGFHRVSLGRKTTGFVRLWLTCGFKITPT
ncbi:transcriptional regulator [Enterobacter cancerogenus]|uniref:Transcriptional regulator n=1 Tax=Enterobacter cancerogenus TaxID=69218 RepID=A0AB38P007_9ENTR|nr:transcriptional regulator [Enterobacter cancerogenus]PNF08981.1 transcriptional regulator [Enterobacter cancerogenus]TKK15922.1 transcriptional regulator [Enterobacter cancerogenus]